MRSDIIKLCYMVGDDKSIVNEYCLGILVKTKKIAQSRRDRQSIFYLDFLCQSAKIKVEEYNYVPIYQSLHGFWI